MFSPKSDIKPRGPLTASLVLSWNLMNPNHLKLDIISYGWATIKFVIRLPIRSWRLLSSDQNRNYNCGVKSSDIKENECFCHYILYAFAHYLVHTLESGINVPPWINIVLGTFGKTNKHSPLNKHSSLLNSR